MYFAVESEILGHTGVLIMNRADQCYSKDMNIQNRPLVLYRQFCFNFFLILSLIKSQLWKWNVSDPVDSSAQLMIS